MLDEAAIFRTQDRSLIGALLAETCVTLGMTHGALGKMLGMSRRTVSRWAREGTVLSRNNLVTLARAVHRRDRRLAGEFAAQAGETLVSFGLEVPVVQVPAPIGAPGKLLDAVVCAAAEALDASPRKVRPALLAALRCAREAGLTMEQMETMLSAAAVGAAAETA